MRSRNRERTRANQPRKKDSKIEAISWTRPVDEDRSLYFLRAISLLVNRTARGPEEKRVYLDNILEPELKLATRGLLKQGFIKRRQRVERKDISRFKQQVESSLNGSRTREIEMNLGDFTPEQHGRNGRFIVSLVVNSDAPAYPILASANNTVREKWWTITNSKSDLEGLSPRIDIAQVGSKFAGAQIVEFLKEDEIVIGVQRKSGKPIERLYASDIPVVLQPAVEYPIRLRNA